MQVDVRPHLPTGFDPGIGIVGCGRIVRDAHLVAYARYGLRVAGAYDVDPAAVEAARAIHDIGRAYASYDDLLADPAVAVVDVATHPGVRAELVRRALLAGKHVLAQKPLAPDLASARELVELAERLGLHLAVNQNGRWAPAWRAATLLVQAGAIGQPLSVTHLQEEHNRWLVGDRFDEVDQFVLYDFTIHWLDITRCWLEGQQPLSVRAREYRTPGQPPEARQPWGAVVDVAYAEGTSAVVRVVGCSELAEARFPFWIHGSEGTITGRVATGEHVDLERNGEITRVPLEGAWFTDGFAGTMGELLSAIVEEREPYNSGRHNLLSLELTLAACSSARDDGTPVAIGAGRDDA